MDEAELQALMDRADAGDQEALAQLRMLLGLDQGYAPGDFTTGQVSPFSDPYASSVMQPILGDSTSKNLNLYQDIVSELADPVTAGFTGGEGFAPGSFQEQATMETFKAKTHNILMRYMQGNDWTSIAAEALLDNQTPGEAVRLVQDAVDQGIIEAPLPPPRTGTQQVDEMQQVRDFATKNFEALADEPSPGASNVEYNQDTQMFEVQTGTEKTPMMEKYDSLGLPYPTEEYTPDWLARNDNGQTARLDEAYMNAQLGEQSLRPTLNARGRPLNPQARGIENAARGMVDAVDLERFGPRPLQSLNEGGLAWQASRDHGEQMTDTMGGMIDSQSARVPFGGHNPNARPDRTAERRERDEEARREDTSPSMTMRRMAAFEGRRNVQAERSRRAIELAMLRMQGRTPLGDVYQARSVPMSQAGVIPPWG